MSWGLGWASYFCLVTAPLSNGFSRQEYWSGLPFPSPRDLPNLGIELESPVLADISFTNEPLGKPRMKEESKSHSVVSSSLWPQGNSPRPEYWIYTVLVILLGKSHGQRNLVGYSPWGRKESDTERLYLLTLLPYSRGSFQPRDRTQVSLIAGGFFTSWATKDWGILK